MSCFKSTKGLSLLLVVVLSTILMIGCSVNAQSEKIAFNGLTETHEGQRRISEKAEELNGDLVTIEGWMSPLSPIGANYFYLIGVPGNDCPFCAGFDVNYYDVVIVYLEEGREYEFTYEPISVTGIFDVGLKEGEEDLEGYYRINVTNIRRDIQEIKNTN